MPEDNLPESSMRASDADRERVARLLGEALAEGRLTAEEHDERIANLYAARTYGEVAPLLADLPDRANEVGLRSPSGEVAQGTGVSPLLALLSSTSAHPTGRIAGQMHATALLGNARVDLRYADMRDGIAIQAQAVFGAVDIYVPLDARVTMTGVPILGALQHPYEPGPVDGPKVAIRAVALFGTVTVHRKPLERGKTTDADG
ncbi:MAG: DUF1707 SHOCT-like domain-containing protein [Streptosporangiales bacterium]